MSKTLKNTIFSILLIIALLFIFHHAFLPFFGGLIFAYLIVPLTEIFAKKISRSWAILLVYLLLTGILALLFYLILPQFFQELRRLAEYLPVYMEKLTQWLVHFDGFYDQLQLPESFKAAVLKAIGGAEEKVASLIGRTLGLLPTMVGNIVSFALIPVTAFYFLRDKELINRRLQALLNPKIREAMDELWTDIHHMLRQFIRGYCVVAFLVGFFFFIALLIVGMDYALVFGLLMAFGELIPYFGPFLAVLPVLFLGALQGWGMFVKVLIAFFVVQQLESCIFTPKIMGHSVGLHPLVVILAVLVGGYWLGFAGLILGVPIFAILRLVLVWGYRRVAGTKGENQENHIVY